MNATNSTSTQALDDATNSSFQAVASAADAQSAGSVSTLSLIQQARLSNQKRALALAIATYGKDSKQATTAQQTVTATTTAAARLTALAQQATTAAPTVAATGWALHGRVYSSALAPQSGFAVFLVDAQKNYLSDYGYSYTDNTGYFLITYTGATTGSSQSAAGAGTASKGSSEPGGSTSPSQDAAITPQLFLEITDAKANPVLLSETPFVPVTGKATYQSITLPAGGMKLGDLPPDVRAVALPPLATPPAPKREVPKSPAEKAERDS